MRMTYGVLFERITTPDAEAGSYYAHLPTLGLTTHGVGIEGARAAAEDLVRLWLAERLANGETLEAASEFLFSTVEVSDDALQSA